jgi:hypothetical protein
MRTVGAPPKVTCRYKNRIRWSSSFISTSALCQQRVCSQVPVEQSDETTTKKTKPPGKLPRPAFLLQQLEKSERNGFACGRASSV